MNKVRTAEFKKRLLANREKIAAGIRQKTREIKEKSGLTGRRAESSKDVHGAYCDIPEIDTELEASLVQMENNKLALINEALRQLELGEYGHCFDCYNEISEDRLNALPFAIRCKNCEELREKPA